MLRVNVPPATRAAPMPSSGGAAFRRRERRLRSFWKHEQYAIKMALACATHHSWLSRASACVQTAPALVAENAAPALAAVFSHALGVHAAPAHQCSSSWPPHLFSLTLKNLADRHGRAGSSSAGHRENSRDSGCPVCSRRPNFREFGKYPVRRVAFARTVDRAKVGSPLPAVPVSPWHVSTPGVEVPLVVMEYVQPNSVLDALALAPAVSYAAPAPVVAHVAPAPAVTFAAPAPAGLAPVVKFVDPAPAASFAAPAPQGRFCRSSTSS